MIVKTNSVPESKCWSGSVPRTVLADLPDVDPNYNSWFFNTRKWVMRKMNSRFIKPLSPVSWCWCYNIPWSDMGVSMLFES